MWHTVMNVEDGGMYNQRRESTKCSQVLPADGQCLTMDSPTSVDSPSFEHIPSCYFRLDNRYLLDPKLLFVGPRIGEGAHAKVYEGKYCEQNVAIKITQRGETPEELAKRQRRFSREISMLARVQHKNLVKFIGACKEPVMVVVTELLQGGSLRKYLMNLRPKRLDIQIAVSFALDIAQAMDRLHKHGIIHRDLKPDNLILTSDHKTVKLVDFGLAREETLTEMMTAETGTYRWMAPELYSTVTLRHGEKKHYNHKVDVYSFAIVLWELLTNRMPFEGMSNLQAAYAAAFKGTRPTLSGNLNLPEDLVFIMQSCWEEDPNVRPDFTQIVRMLNAFLSSLVPQEYTAPQQQVVSKDASSTWSANDKQEEPMMANPEVIQNQKSSVLKCFCQCFSQGHIRTSSFQGC